MAPIRGLLCSALALLALPFATAVEQDCNGNRREDLDDFFSGFSTDCNANCIPDECDLLPTYAGVSQITVHRVEMPDAVVALDLDADGDLDLVSANRNSNNLTVFENDGGGGFKARVHLSTGPEPFELITGDWDGDGDDDLAVAFAGGGVGILRNDGSGLPAATGTISVGGSPSGLAAGDFDDDGDLDLAVAVIDAAKVRLLRNSGASFSQWQEMTVGFGPRATITAGDLTGDGVPDIVVDSRYSVGDDTFQGISVIRNRGDGGFELPQNRRTTHSPESLAIADIDGDGHQDIAVAEDSRLLGVFWNLGGGSFPGIASEWDTGRSINDIAARDMDGDGDLDLVLGGDGVFIVDQSAPRVFLFLLVLEDSGTSGRHAIAVADLEGDGDPDIATVETNWWFGVYANDDPFFPLVQNDFLRFSVHDVASGHFDGDGAVDLLFLDRESATIAMLPNSGAGRFERSYPVTIDGSPEDLVDIAAGDLNNDGLDDAILADHSSSMLYLLLSAGGAPFQELKRIALSGQPRHLAVGDINGDGRVDLAVSEAGTVLTILSNIGAVDFAAQSTSLDYRPGPLALADFDGDLRVDIAVSAGTSVWIYLQRPGSVVVRGEFSLDDSNLATQALSFGAADFDRDGRVDLAATLSKRLHLLRNTAAAELDSIVEVRVRGPRFTVADLNGDGWPEFVTADTTDSEVEIVEMKALQESTDGDGDGLPDECIEGGDPPVDCNANGLPDGCDLAQHVSEDCNRNFVPDECDIGSGESSDCNRNGRPDECDLAAFISFDCNRNGVPDECDIAAGRSRDTNQDGVPDECSTPEFLRGDVNEDGVVTLSDAYALEWGYYQTRVDVHPERIPCQDAWDADDNGQIDISDAAVIEGLVLGKHSEPPPPYPEPGFDPTDDPLDCRIVEPRPPLADPHAKLSVLDAVARGGDDGTVVLTFALSSSVPIGGFYASLDVGEPRVLEGARRGSMQDLTGTEDHSARDVWRSGNRLNLYYIHSPYTAVAYPPSQSTAVLEIRACLDAGVVAGEYPLSLVGGELIEYEGSRRIDPVLESATLRVLSDLTTSEECQSAPPLLACGVDAAYVSGFLLLRFELGTSEPIDWSVWIVGSGFAFPLINTRLPVIDPAAAFPVAFPFPAGLGPLAIVTVLTPSLGDPCVDFAVVSTGAPGSGP